MIIVGLTGYIDSGKTTIGKTHSDIYSYSKVMGYAEPIYDMIHAGFGIPYHIIANKKERDIPRPELGGHTIRYAMQTLGTQWGRDLIAKNVWVKQTIRKIKRLRGVEMVFLENCRFPNEVDLMKENFDNFILVYIDNPEIVPDTSHESEQYIEELSKLADYTLINKPSENSLEEAACQLNEIVFGSLLDLTLKKRKIK